MFFIWLGVKETEYFLEYSLNPQDDNSTVIVRRLWVREKTVALAVYFLSPEIPKVHALERKNGEYVLIS